MARLRPNRGLTLIEILVITSVIAILVAILMPVFGRGKVCAQQAKCASNLRQLGGAFSMYASDWNGFLPSPGGLPGDWHYWSQSAGGGLTRYVGNRSGGFDTIWCCPMMREWDCPWPVRSYGMNSFLRNPSDVHYPTCVGVLGSIRQDAIPSPRSTILLYEGVQMLIPHPDEKPEYTQPGIYIYRCGNWEEVRGWANGPRTDALYANQPMHGNVNNYLYCDGHVIARPPDRRMADGVHQVTYRQVKDWFVDKQKYRHMYP